MTGFSMKMFEDRELSWEGGEFVFVWYVCETGSGLLTRGSGDLDEMGLSGTGDLLAMEETGLEETEETRFEGETRIEKAEEKEGVRGDETRFLLANLSQDFPVQDKAYPE